MRIFLARLFVPFTLAVLVPGLVHGQDRDAEPERPRVRKVPKKVPVTRIPPLEQPLNPPSPRPDPKPKPLPDPRPGPVARPDPAPQGTGLAAGVLRDKLGTEGFRSFVNQIEQLNPANQGARGGCGTSFRCQDVWFDNGAPPPSDTSVVRPEGTRFFNTQFKPPSERESRETVRDFGGQPGGGVVLQGAASGLAPIAALGYDRQFNALVLDGSAVYFIRMPPGRFMELCRAIAREDKLGVSLGRTRLVYGALPKSSEVAFDLTLADRFLGDIVFAREDWIAGYRFVGGYVPQKDPNLQVDMAVMFRFKGFAFQVRQREVVPAGGGMEVSLVPLSRDTAPDGNLLPDYDAIRAGNLSAPYVANARHLAENMQHYRREQIVQRAFIYGEAAALLRWLKDEGVDLDELAAQIR